MQHVNEQKQQMMDKHQHAQIAEKFAEDQTMRLKNDEACDRSNAWLFYAFVCPFNFLISNASNTLRR